MQLDRNIRKDGKGKYALIKLRDTGIDQFGGVTSVSTRAVDYGDTCETDFFVIRLKDKHAEPALRAYAESAMRDDPEYGMEVMRLAELASSHPLKGRPS